MKTWLFFTLMIFGWTQLMAGIIFSRWCDGPQAVFVAMVGGAICIVTFICYDFKGMFS